MSTPWRRDTSGSSDPAVPSNRVASARERRRSFGFVEREGERWTVFLVTHRGEDGQWRGYFAYRPASGEAEGSEVRTANLFLERTEPEVDTRARGLGRPLVLALLESALHTDEKRRGFSADARRWFRRFLADHAAEVAPDIGTLPAELSLTHLRSLYDSYRLDQIGHLIALTEAEHFRGIVERLLDGREIDFRSRDRLQLAMLVVQELERYLPLPPFEVWVEDFMAHREEYHRYSHELHREGRLA